MEYRQLGKSGLRVSVIGLGGNTFGRYADEQQTAAIVRQALASGVNMIDTADTYGNGVSEELLGKAIRGHRDELVIATKVGMHMGDGPNEHGSSRRRVIAGCEASLRRLQIETIDLYQIHAFDPLTPLEETLGALDDLVRAGKVRYIGCSNYDGWRIVQALWISDRAHLAHFVSVQPEYSLLKREVEREIVPVCLEFGLGVIPFFPLGAGVLTGKYKPGEAAPEGTRGHDNPRFASRLHASHVGSCAAAGRLGARCWPHRRRTGARLAGVASRRQHDYRGHDQTRAGRRQCPRRRLEAHRRRSGRGRTATG